jgi:aminopeptidase-like protein
MDEMSKSEAVKFSKVKYFLQNFFRWGLDERWNTSPHFNTAVAELNALLVDIVAKHKVPTEKEGGKRG